MEAQAQHMLQASIAGYGTGVDPQLATEALLTGAAPSLSYQLAQGDPALAKTLLAQPIGDSTFTSKGTPPPTAMYNDPYAYNPNQHQQMVQSSGNENTFKGMGDLPVANLGWFNSVLQSDPNNVKKWQQFLADNGFYGQNSADGKSFQKGEVNGYNSTQFQQGMRDWALAYFLPQALYSRDPQEITNARQFLSAMPGGGISVDSIAQQMAFNPAQREKVIDSWLQAQGPGANKIQALNLFSDHFGSQNLPDQLNQLRGDGVFGHIGDFFHHFLPFIGSDDQQKLKDLTPAEQQLLAPALQQAHDQSPFMKFMGDVFSAPSKAMVTGALFFNDAVHGDVENPFDAGSKIRQSADQFVANPMGQIFGQQFVKDHPFLSTFGNFAVNVFDDPLTYIPFVGEANMAEKIGKGIEGFDKMSETQKATALAGKMTRVEKATGGLISHRVGTLRYGYIKPTTVIRQLAGREGGNTIAKLLDPISAAQEDIAKALTTKNIDHGLVRSMLGMTNEKDFDKVEKILEMGKTPAGSSQILNFLRDPKNGLADRLFSMDTLVHRHQFDKILKAADKWGSGKAMPVWHTLHMNDSGSLLLMNQPNTAIEALRNSAMIAGVAPEEFQQFSTQFWKASGNDLTRLNLAQQMDNKISDAFEKRLANTSYLGKKGVEGFKAFGDNLRLTSRQVKGAPLYSVSHHPGEAGTETSFATTTKFTKDSEKYTAKQLNDMVAEKENARDALTAQWQTALDAATKNLGSQELALGDPAIADIGKSYQTAAKGLQDSIDSFVKEHGGGTQEKKAVPMTTTQSAIYHHTRFTPAEMAAYINPALRKSEWIQRRWGIDNAMRVWKTITLSKPSTSMRIVFGDESSRGHIHLLLNDQGAWWSYMKNVLTHKGYDPKKFVTEHPEAVVTSHTLAQLGAGLGKFVPMVAGQQNYRHNFTNLIEQHYGKQQWVKEWTKAVDKPLKAGEDWEKAGKDALAAFFRGDHQEARDLRDFVHVPDIKKGKNDAMDQLVASRHEELRSLTHPDRLDVDRMRVFNWLKKGEVDSKELHKLEREVKGSTDDTYVLPQIHGLPAMMGSPIGNWTEWYHSFVADRISHARGRVFGAKYDLEQKRLGKFYAQQLKEGSMSGADIAEMADSAAASWVQKNTYQGSRTIMGNTLRTVAPFWGATANSNKFYLHTLMEHPETAVPLLGVEQAVTQAQSQGGLRVSASDVPVLGNMLSHMGLDAGDSFTFEPFNALFLTREGFGGLMPGAGPIFNVALGAAPPSVKDWVAQDVPGMQYAANASPIAPWLTEGISAAGLAMGKGGLEAPFIGRPAGYYAKLTDEKLRQLEANWQQGGRKGPAPTEQDAMNDVAKNQLVTGALGLGVPIGAAAQDTTQAQIRNAEKQWDPNLSPADKNTFFSSLDPKISDYFRFIDPHTPETPVDGKDSKQDILARSPWIQAYTTGMGQSVVPGRVTSADTQAQYRKDVASGAIRTLSPTEYIYKLRQQEQMTQAWNEFDRLQSAYQNFLVGSGVATDSTQAKLWRKQNYDPILQSMVKDYPDWGSTFVKQTTTSAIGQEYASEPFYSVSTFNVLPRNPALETKTTTLWRAALVRRDQATSAMEQVLAAGGSTYEKEMILQGLAQQLDQLASQDPTFAAQISRYKYKNLDDLINFKAGQMVNQAQGFATS